MKNFIVIAEQDRGKSFFVKSLLKKFHLRKNYINDINLEYGEFKNEVKKLMSREDFISFVPCNTQPKSNVNVVFEEATTFFSNSGNSPLDIMTHIYRRFHTGNLNIFVFHNLSKVPTDILNSIDFLILFRTKDDPQRVFKKFVEYPKIVSAFNSVRKKTEGTRFNRELKTYDCENSKKFFHYNEVIKM